MAVVGQTEMPLNLPQPETPVLNPLLLERLEALEPDDLTPRQAHDLLYELVALRDAE